MKELLKKYIEKGYEPPFFARADNRWSVEKDSFISASRVSAGNPIDAEKLELYLMRDWAEEMGVLVEVTLYDINKYAYEVILLSNPDDSEANFDNTSRVEALKSALEEAIEFVGKSN